MAINSVAISGNLTREPDFRQTASGMGVLTFGVAVNDRRKNKQTGEWEDYANFIDCTVIGNRAESLSRYLAKGMKVAVSGKLRYSQWERDGQKRSKVEVMADEVVFMSAAQQQQQPRPQQQQQPPRPQPQYVQASVYDEDIPF